MKLLEPLLARRAESRYTVNDYAAWVTEAFNFGGLSYPLGLTMSMTPQRTETVGADFVGHVQGGYASNGIVWTCCVVRLQVFSQARLMFQRMTRGRPGDLSAPPRLLGKLEHPWPGGTTGDLLAKMILHADLAGNSYVAVDDDGNLGCLRPDWVDIILGMRIRDGLPMGSRRFGYAYFEGGHRDRDPVVMEAEDVAHFAPYPDPLAEFRGMSWVTPVVREIIADRGATVHKGRFFDNAATPNLAVKLSDAVLPTLFDEFVERMETGHRGASNAYKTLYLGGGADVTVVGSDFRQLDFKVVQGAGETRIAAASGVGAIIAQFSEGMQGSSLNAGNYGAARRRFSDIPMLHAWQNAAGSLETLVPPPTGSRLWYDASDISFLQEDARDAADIWAVKAKAMGSLIAAGYSPESVTKATAAEDESLLVHTGLTSVQLQPPGTAEPQPSEEVPDDDDTDDDAA